MFYASQILKNYFSFDWSNNLAFVFRLKKNRMGRKGIKTRIKKNLMRTFSELKFRTRKMTLSYQGLHDLFFLKRKHHLAKGKVRSAGELSVC